VRNAKQWAYGTLTPAGADRLIARQYYVHAALDLESETKKIRNLLRIALQVLEDAGMVRLNRDSSGEIVGMHHDVSTDLFVSDSFKFSEFNEVKDKQNVK
jgi:hypothetical protein